MKQILPILLTFFISLNLCSQNIDIDILRNINSNRNKELDNTFKCITNSACVVSIAAPIIMYSAGIITNNETTKEKGIYIAETVLIAAFISTGLKLSMQRERPFETYPDIEKVSGGGSFSFPSGHTSDVFATATGLSIAYPKWYVIAPTFAWASTVGYTRMSLGIHYPSDVLAGALCDAGSAFLTYKLNNWINTRTQKNTPMITAYAH